MKHQASRRLLVGFLVCGLATIGLAQSPRGKRGGPPAAPPPVQAGVYTNVSGSIAQFNYGKDGDIEGFLLDKNTLVHLSPQAALIAANSLHAGDAVQIAGLSQRSPSGFQTLEAQTIQDRTSGKTVNTPQPGPAAPYSGSGRIQQLNYAPDGSVNGFLLENGSLASVPPFGAANPSAIRVGASVTYSGYAHTTISGRTVVDVQSLSVNGQTLTLAAGAPPAGRTGEPPPPPAPPAQTPQN